MEELDALTDAEVENQRDQDSKLKLSLSPDSLSASEASSPRGSEKKVRFSAELVQGAHTRQTAGSQDSASSESRCLSSLKASSPKKNQHKVQGPQQPLESAKQDDGSAEDEGGGPSAASPVVQQSTLETKCTQKDNSPSTAPCTPPPEKACASLQESSVQPVELAKSNISNTNTGMQ